MRAFRQPLLVLSGDLTVETANPAFYRAFDARADQTEGRPVHELGDGQWDIPALRRLLEELLPTGREIEGFRVEHRLERIGRRVLLLNASRMERAGHPDRILLAIDDITEREELRFELEGEKELAEKIIDATRDSLLILGWDLRVRSANETFYTTFKVDPAATEGRLVYELGNGQWDIPALRDLLENVLPENNAFDDFVVEHRFEQIGCKVMLLNARRIDHMQLILLAIEDITESKRAEDVLRASEQRLRKVLETDAVGVLFLDSSGTLVDTNGAFLHMTGYSRDDVRSGQLSWRSMTPPEWMAATEAQMSELEATGRLGPYEKEYLLKDGSRSWMMIAGRRVDERTVVKFCMDISDRKRVERERELLTRELSHRVKNILAVVQALANQTDGRLGSVEAFREAFLGRLHAMARAHNMLLDTDWRGSELGALVRQTMDAYREERPDAVAIEGEPVRLTPSQSLGLSLVLHELATNAAKYGALADPGGRTRVSWCRQQDHDSVSVRLRWQELGGQPVEPPAERGFGSRLIEQAIALQLHGSVELDYAPDGLTCCILFPLT